MNVTFACPSCDQTVRVDGVTADTRSLECSACDVSIQTPLDGIQAGGQGAAKAEAGAEAADLERLTRCLVCPSTDLFVRKDFNQRLGVTIILVGFVASTITWNFYLQYWTFAILFATALIDLLLYMLVGNLVQCYRCHAEYRGVTEQSGIGTFSLETHERYRQQAARLANHQDS